MIIGIDGSRLSGRRTGTEFYSQQVIAALIPLAQAQGHWVRLYVREPIDLSMLSIAPNELVHIRQPHLWTHIGLAREIVQRPPDVLFVPSHVLPLACAWRRKPRTVVTIHDVGYRHFPAAHPLRQWLYLELSTWFTARFADALIVDSQITKQDVGRFYNIGENKMTVALLGPLPAPEVTPIDVQRVRVKFNLPEDRPYVLHVGTLQPRKNLRRLMEAVAEVEREAKGVGHGALHAPRPSLVLAGGSGWGSEDLRTEVQRLGIADRVIFTGYVSDEEKAALLRAAAVYACPSLYEGFGLPVLEAQAMGVPVICSNTSSLPEVAGEGALLFDPQSVNEIGQALHQVLVDPSVRDRLIRLGHANVARFSWRDCAERILEKIEKAEGRRQKGEIENSKGKIIKNEVKDER